MQGKEEHLSGAASGGRDVLRPLQPLASTGDAAEAGSLAWRQVQDTDQLDAGPPSARRSTRVGLIRRKR
jgi:hypothetical protein